MSNFFTAINDFWCEHCRKDFTLPCGFKADWGFDVTRGKPYKISDHMWYIARCPKCNRMLYRSKTSQQTDPYFFQSFKVRSEARKHEIDTLQPSDPRFDFYYPQYKREREAKLEAKEKELWNQKKKRV